MSHRTRTRNKKFYTRNKRDQDLNSDFPVNNFSLSSSEVMETAIQLRHNNFIEQAIQEMDYIDSNFVTDNYDWEIGFEKMNIDE